MPYGNVSLSFFIECSEKNKVAVCSNKSANESTAYGIILKRIENKLFRDGFDIEKDNRLVRYVY